MKKQIIICALLLSIGCSNYSFASVFDEAGSNQENMVTSEPTANHTTNKRAKLKPFNTLKKNNDVQFKPSLRKFGKFLAKSLSNQEETSAKTDGANTPNTSAFVHRNQHDQIQVYIDFFNLDEAVEKAIRNAGLTIELVSSDLNRVQGWANEQTLLALAEDSNVLRISAPNYAFPKSGAAVTQGDQILGSDLLRQIGHTGKGVRVGILSDGAKNWTQARDSGDLPAKITLYGNCDSGSTSADLCRAGGGTCNEGTAMAEIVHDIAPDADIAVASVRTSLEFIDKINTLINDFGADIIVDDLGFYGEPSFYDGDIATAVANASKRVLFVSAAGNDGYGHYLASYRGSHEPIWLDNPNYSNTSVHTFVDPLRGNTYYPAEEDHYHGFIVTANSASTVILQWDGRLGGFGSRNALRLRIHDSQGYVVYASDGTRTASPEDAIEGVCIPNPSNDDKVYFVTVELTNGPVYQFHFRLFFLGQGAIEYPMAESSIFGHPSVERVLAVGTINSSQVNTGEVAFYSSQGPALIHTTSRNSVTGGAQFESQQKRRKPDLVALDQVSVSGAGGFPSLFYGTSAAAPHVAGIAAQLMSVTNLVKADDVRRALINGAQDIGKKGFDFTSGYGLVDAEQALDKLQYGNPLPAIFLLLDKR
ncbi:S8 family peptidase [Arenicella xantha]|uniref:S8 family peptidase n=1 Tax=Arenicella xantha TaxID=644221 RepID=UPI001475CFCF|nr:S8 family serine peptidase [Arenicella xantha]